MPLTNAAKAELLQLWVNQATSIKMMLLDANHSTDIDTQEFIDDVSANEVSGTGYSAGGQTLASVSVVQDNTLNQGELTFDNVVWDADGGTLSARYAVIYDDTGTPGTSKILAIEDFGEVKTADDDNFRVKPDETDGGVTVK